MPKCAKLRGGARAKRICAGPRPPHPVGMSLPFLPLPPLEVSGGVAGGAGRGSIARRATRRKLSLRVPAGDGEFRISGTPWLAEGEWKAIGPKSLTANCFCERRNGSLHPLDDAALFFFRFHLCVEFKPSQQHPDGERFSLPKSNIGNDPTSLQQN